jgi:hypothetical protein
VDGGDWDAVTGCDGKGGCDGIGGCDGKGGCDDQGGCDGSGGCPSTSGGQQPSSKNGMGRGNPGGRGNGRGNPQMMQGPGGGLNMAGPGGRGRSRSNAGADPVYPDACLSPPPNPPAADLTPAVLPPSTPAPSVSGFESYCRPEPELNSTETFLFKELTPVRTELETLRKEMVRVTTAWPSIRVVKQKKTSGSSLDLSEYDSKAEDICKTLISAIPTVGLNGMGHVVGTVCFPEQGQMQGESECQGKVPLLIDGIVVYDFIHAAGAMGLGYALRHANAKDAYASTWALYERSITNYGSTCPGLYEKVQRAPYDAPQHAGAWQATLARMKAEDTALLAPQPPETEKKRFAAFWRHAMGVCGEMLNKGVFVGCLHGVAHGVLKYILYPYDNPEESFQNSKESDTKEVQCRAARHSPHLKVAQLEAALRLCEAAPTSGLRLVAASGLWMDYFGAYYMSASLENLQYPAAPWLTVNIGGKVRSPCDQVTGSAQCWGRFVPMLGQGAEGGAPTAAETKAIQDKMSPGAKAKFDNLRDSQKQTLINCLIKPMASELNNRGCAFGYGMIYNSAQEPVWQGDGGYAEWCSMFVDHEKATTGTQAEKDRERLRLTACVGGGMYGIGHGTVAMNNIPAWVVKKHCSQLEEAEELNWLTAAQRKEVANVCYNTGHCCSTAGSCEKFEDFLQPAGDACEDSAGVTV